MMAPHPTGPPGVESLAREFCAPYGFAISKFRIHAVAAMAIAHRVKLGGEIADPQIE
jgi:hypothetical protein